MKDIVIKKNDELVVSHRDIANFTNIQQKNIVEMINKYENEIKEFGKLPFETEALKNSATGQSIKTYYLNEHQATFLMTLLKNNEMVVNFKKNLVKQFIKMKNIIENKRISFLQDVAKNQKDSIVQVIDGEPLISHRHISLCTYIPERQISRIIKRTINILEKYRPVKIKKVDIVDYPKGKEPIVYYLDERQTLILLSYIKANPFLFELKAEIIDNFMAFREIEQNKGSNILLENKIEELETKIENMKKVLS